MKHWMFVPHRNVVNRNDGCLVRSSILLLRVAGMHLLNREVERRSLTCRTVLSF